MAEITAALVKQLRDATNVSMMDCKRALVETDGDMDAATKLLRERGVAVAAKRAAKAANQGLVASDSSADGSILSLVEVNCETDFVARNENFQAFVKEIAAKAVETDEDLGETMKDDLMDRIAAIGENMKIRRNLRYVCEQTGKIAAYIHLGGKVGVLIEVACEKAETAASPVFAEVVKDLTLHVAAAAPKYLVADDVPAEEIEAEKDIFRKQVEGKPENIIDKIVDGKIKKFFGEICLVDQGFVKEPKQSIAQLLAEKGKELDDTLTVQRFVRYQLGA